MRRYLGQEFFQQFAQALHLPAFVFGFSFNHIVLRKKVLIFGFKFDSAGWGKMQLAIRVEDPAGATATSWNDCNMIHSDLRHCVSSRLRAVVNRVLVATGKIAGSVLYSVDKRLILN